MADKNLTPDEVDYSDPEATPDVAEVGSLTGLINNLVTQIEALRQEISKIKEMADGYFENDPTYRAHDTAVKEASKIRSQTKKQIQKIPQVADLLNRIQNAKSLLKEKNKSLSDYLQDYAKTTGATQFETDDGQVRQIVYEARLVNKSNIR